MWAREGKEARRYENGTARFSLVTLVGEARDFFGAVLARVARVDALTTENSVQQPGISRFQRIENRDNPFRESELSSRVGGNL